MRIKNKTFIMLITLGYLFLFGLGAWLIRNWRIVIGVIIMMWAYQIQKNVYTLKNMK